MNQKKKLKDYIKSSFLWSTVFEIEKLGDLEKEIESPEFWSNQKRAKEVKVKISDLREKKDSFESLKKEIKELKEFLSIVKEEDLEGKLLEVEKKIKDFKIKSFLSDVYDLGGCIFTLKSGAGGRDAEDWTVLLFEMYKKYFINKDWMFRVISESFGESGGPEGRIGLKEVVCEVKGKYAYGLLKKETGVHRLVRMSPFSSKQLRHTSFASVEVLPKIEDISEVALKEEDLKLDTFRSSGKGGQNVNKRETAVRLTHIPTGLVSSCQSERLQIQNKKFALQILAAKIMRKKEEEREKEIKAVRGDKMSVDFGHQIRSYVFHPYQLVKDHRTGVEVKNVESVLGGNLDQFIEKEITI